MAVEIVMPRLSDSMEEGTILQWFVATGDEVKEGEPLVEVETDKASVTYESEHEGILLAVHAEAGENVAVGGVIAVIGAEGESVAGVAAGASVSSGSAGSAGSTGSAGSAGSTGSAGSAGSTGSAGSPGAAAVAAPVPSPPSSGASGRVKASPLARRIAAELGVDLATLVGSGPQGRVIRADVERSAANPAAAAGDGVEAAQTAIADVPAPAPVPAPASAAVPAGASAKGESTVEQLSRRQRTVARRMAESRATVPDFELRCEVDMSLAVALRDQLRDISDQPPSYNDFIVKAAALALREFPRVNGSYVDAAFERYSRVNVGIAVAAEDALVVPTIFDADTKSLAEIAAGARTLAARVRDGSISPAELAGGTFSISNLGMYGLDSFSAVINPPQAAILAVGSLKPRAVVDDTGAVVARPTINLTLACDHRILYGADGARFLARVRALLEKPLSLLV